MRHRRRPPRKRHSEDYVVRRLHGGEALRLTYTRTGPEWSLWPSGEWVAREAAELVIARPDVAGVGDSLFAGVRSQTFRFIEPERRPSP
jgi:hypothetical protein